MLVTCEYQGESVTFRLDGQGRVGWMDRWEIVDELVGAGMLTRRHLGPATYGHCEYRLVTA